MPFRPRRTYTITGGGGCADLTMGRALDADQIDTRSRNFVSTPLGTLTLRPGMRTVDPTVVATSSRSLFRAGARYICDDLANGKLVYTVDGGISGSYIAALKGFWKFADNMDDATTNNNDMTPAGTPSYSTSTPIATGNKCLDADGSDDKGTLASASSTGMDLGDSFALFCWVKVDALSSGTTNQVFGKFDTSTPGGWRLEVLEGSSTYSLRWHIYWPEIGAMLCSVAGGVTGSWYFAALTYDRSKWPESSLNSYAGTPDDPDNLKLTFSAEVDHSPATGTADLVLAHNGSDFLNGDIFEPGVCNTGLSLSQLTDIYTAGVDATLGA